MVIFLSGHRLRNNREVTGSVVLNTGNCLFTSVSQAWVENGFNFLSGRMRKT